MTEILTINDLRDAIDNDSNNHRIKEIAELFWTAMNDWPTYNQINIKGFINELYDYYGFPLNIDKIKRKKLNLNIDGDTWRHESGSSIAEIIEISRRFDNESDFDRILNQIINYIKGT